MFTSILKKMHLAPSPNDPCLFTGIVGEPDSAATVMTSTPPPEELVHHTIPTPKNNATPVKKRAPIRVCVYVDNFIFYSTDPVEEELFRTELAKHITVDFMGDVDYFLGTTFHWKGLPEDHVSVHMTQTAFTECLEVYSAEPCRS